MNCLTICLSDTLRIRITEISRIKIKVPWRALILALLFDRVVGVLDKIFISLRDSSAAPIMRRSTT